MDFEGEIISGGGRGGSSPLTDVVSVTVSSNGTAQVAVPEKEAREVFGADDETAGRVVVVKGSGPWAGKVALIAQDHASARDLRRPPRRRSFVVSLPFSALGVREDIAARVPFQRTQVKGRPAVVFELKPHHMADYEGPVPEGERARRVRRKASEAVDPTEEAA